MNITRTNITRHAAQFAQSVLVATVVAATAAPALAQETPVAPIEIQSCAPIYAPQAQPGFTPGIMLPAGVEVTYVNRATVAVNDVTFRFGGDSAAPTAEDRNTLAPGAAVKHAFWADGSPIAGCSVSAVRFADGAAVAQTTAAVSPNR